MSSPLMAFQGVPSVSATKRPAPPVSVSMARSIASGEMSMAPGRTSSPPVRAFSCSVNHFDAGRTEFQYFCESGLSTPNGLSAGRSGSRFQSSFVYHCTIGSRIVGDTICRSDPEPPTGLNASATELATRPALPVNVASGRVSVSPTACPMTCSTLYPHGSGTSTARPLGSISTRLRSFTFCIRSES